MSVCDSSLQDELSAEKGELVEVVDSLSRKLQEAIVARDSAQSKLRELNDSFSVAVAEKEAAAAEKLQLSNTIKALGDEKEAAAAKKQSTSELVESLRAEIAVSEARLREADGALQATKKQLLAAQEEKDQLLAARRLADETSEALKGDNAKLGGLVHNLREELESLKINLTKSLTAAQQRQSVIEEDRGSLETEKKNLAALVEDLQSKLSSADLPAGGTPAGMASPEPKAEPVTGEEEGEGVEAGFGSPRVRRKALSLDRNVLGEPGKRDGEAAQPRSAAASSTEELHQAVTEKQAAKEAARQLRARVEALTADTAAAEAAAEKLQARLDAALSGKTAEQVAAAEKQDKNQRQETKQEMVRGAPPVHKKVNGTAAKSGPVSHPMSDFGDDAETVEKLEAANVALTRQLEEQQEAARQAEAKLSALQAQLEQVIIYFLTCECQKRKTVFLQLSLSCEIASGTTTSNDLFWTDIEEFLAQVGILVCVQQSSHSLCVPLQPADGRQTVRSNMMLTCMLYFWCRSRVLRSPQQRQPELDRVRPVLTKLWQLRRSPAPCMRQPARWLMQSRPTALPKRPRPTGRRPPLPFPRPWQFRQLLSSRRAGQSPIRRRRTTSGNGSQRPRPSFWQPGTRLPRCRGRLRPPRTGSSCKKSYRKLSGSWRRHRARMRDSRAMPSS
jgi:hypothetical protein